MRNAIRAGVLGLVLAAAGCDAPAPPATVVDPVVKSDDATAVEMIRPLAEQGDAEAQYNLGLMYKIGQGVPQDYAETVKWYRKAADQGLNDAQNNLGVMYYSGMGVPQDYVQAHLWFSLAAAAGNRNALGGRNQVAAKMTPGRIAEAQKLAQQWTPKKVATP